MDKFKEKKNNIGSNDCGLDFSKIGQYNVHGGNWKISEERC